MPEEEKQENLKQEQEQEKQKRQKETQAAQEALNTQNQKKTEKENEEDTGIEDEEMLLERKRKKQQVNLMLNNYFEYIIVLVVIIILLAGYFLLLKPQYEDAVSNLKGSLSGQTRIYQQERRKLETLKKLSETYKNIDPKKIERVNTLLPPDYVKEKLFIELGYVIPQSGFTLNFLEIYKDTELRERSRERGLRQEEQPDIIKKLPDGVGYIKGEVAVGMLDYNGLQKITQIIEENLKMVDIYNINFSPGDATAGFEFYTYYLK